MGNSDSKLSLYRNHIGKLQNENEVPLYSDEVTIDIIVKNYKNCTNSDLFGDFYNYFLSEPFSVDDIQLLLNIKDLKRIYTLNVENYMNMIRFGCLNIHLLTNKLLETNFQLNSTFEKTINQLRNCIRLLTRVLPTFFEFDNADHEGMLEKRLFWNKNGSEVFKLKGNCTLNTNVTYKSYDIEPLGVILLRSCLKLLFMGGFTIPCLNDDTQFLGSALYSLWEDGISIPPIPVSKVKQTPDLDCNRLEMLRLLLILFSRPLYDPIGINNFLIVMCTSMTTKDIEYFSSSLINIVCHSCRGFSLEDTFGLTYSSDSFNMPTARLTSLRLLRQKLVVSSVQLLILTLTFKVPLDTCIDIHHIISNLSVEPVHSNITNLISIFFSGLCRESDLRLILTSMITVIKKPIDEAIKQESNPFNWNSNNSIGAINTSANNNGSKHNKERKGLSGIINSSNSNNQTLPLLSELTLPIIILFWELIKCNSAFENYVANKYGDKLLILIIYYLKYYDTPQLSSTLIPIIGGFSIYLSSNPLILYKMQDNLNLNYYTNKLPNYFKLTHSTIKNFTYRDFAIIQLSNTAIHRINNRMLLNPFIIELIYNLLPVTLDAEPNHKKIILSSSINPPPELPTGLHYNACTVLLHLIAKMSDKDYLMPTSNKTDLEKIYPSLTKSYACSAGIKLDLISLLLRGIIVYINFCYQDAKNLLFAICRHQRIMYRLQYVIQEISDYIEQNNHIQIRDYMDIDSMVQQLIIMENTLECRSFPPQTSLSLIYTENNDKKYRDIETCEEKNGSLNLSTRLLNKKTAVFQHFDYDYDPSLESDEVFFSIRPNWPIGLTPKRKRKLQFYKPLKKNWSGYTSLKLIVKIIQLFNSQFPQISKISSMDYFKLLRHIGAFESDFHDSIEKSLQIELTIEKKIFKPLKINWNNDTISNNWYLSVIWSDIFNSNSSSYYTLLDTNSPSVQTQQSLIKTPIMSSERWSSCGSPLSRTSSNNSLIIHQMDSLESFPNSITNSPSISNGSSFWFNNHNHINEVSDNNGEYDSKSTGDDYNNKDVKQSSFFRLSWSGFIKKDRDKVEETELNKNKELNNVRKGALTLDPGLLKPNIWTGTNISLFKTKVDEREEISLIDIASSFFKRIGLNNTTNTNSNDNLNNTLFSPQNSTFGGIKNSTINQRPISRTSIGSLK